MPESFMTLLPQLLNHLEAIKIPIQTSAFLAEMGIRTFSLGFDLVKTGTDLTWRMTERCLPLLLSEKRESCRQLLEIFREESEIFLNIPKERILEHLGRFHQERLGELEFIKVFTEEPDPQDWSFDWNKTKLLLDLPSLRLLDISEDIDHKIQNYAVVFAPRAGHHSSIAERAAVYMRDHGLSRMAIVEQKCAEDIPLYIEGQKHDEGFDGQVNQYRKILEHLNGLTGHPPHLIAICQPGPLLMSTLILYPHLGKTFGSAGAPMHTEGEKGFLTEFARLMGEDYIDRMVTFFGKTVSENEIGADRESFDGRLQVLGFYFLGMDQHYRNFKKLLADLKQGNEEGAERQKTFYQWYNQVHHFPVEFIRDTYKKVFIRNELIHGTFEIGERKIGIKDYPGSVPIWALGGTKDDITPSLQAIGHMDLIDSVPPDDKLTLLCEGGHMGLFRSEKILKNEYSRIVEFILRRSDA